MKKQIVGMVGVAVALAGFAVPAQASGVPVGTVMVTGATFDKNYNVTVYGAASCTADGAPSAWMDGMIRLQNGNSTPIETTMLAPVICDGTTVTFSSTLKWTNRELNSGKPLQVTIDMHLDSAVFTTTTTNVSPTRIK